MNVRPSGRHGYRRGPATMAEWRRGHGRQRPAGTESRTTRPAYRINRTCPIRQGPRRQAGKIVMDAVNSAPLRLNLLGSFSAFWRDQPLEGFNYDKMRALLAYLSLEHHREHSRETLADLLWESSPSDTWRGNLRRTLSDLRRVLETPTGLELFAATKNSLRFLPQGRIDVLRFRQSPQRCASHPACQQCAS